MSFLLNSYRFGGAPPGPSWIIQQGFEGTGYDNGETWVEAVVSEGTVDPNSTTTVLAGSQSLRLTLPTTQDGASTYNQFTGVSKLYCRMMFRLISFNQVATTSLELASIRNGTTTLATLGIYGQSPLLEVTAAGGSINRTSTALSGSTIYIWFEYEAGTGSNAIARAGWSTTITKPTLTASGGQTCVSSNGTATANATRLYLGRTVTTAYRYVAVYDEIRALGSTF